MRPVLGLPILLPFWDIVIVFNYKKSLKHVKTIFLNIAERPKRTPNCVHKFGGRYPALMTQLRSEGSHFANDKLQLRTPAVMANHYRINPDTPTQTCGIQRRRCRATRRSSWRGRYLRMGRKLNAEITDDNNYQAVWMRPYCCEGNAASWYTSCSVEVIETEVVRWSCD